MSDRTVDALVDAREEIESLKQDKQRLIEALVEATDTRCRYCDIDCYQVCDMMVRHRELLKEMEG